MKTEYRGIDWVFPTTVSEENLPTIKQLLNEKGFVVNTTRVEQGIHMHVTNEMHWEDIDVFRKIAPYVTGHVIMETYTPEESWEKKWLHLIYGGGTVQEIVTPAFQRDIDS